MNPAYQKAVVFCNGDPAPPRASASTSTRSNSLVGCDGRDRAHPLARPHAACRHRRFRFHLAQEAARLESKEVEYFRYPTDKPFTDSTSASPRPANRGCTEIILALRAGRPPTTLSATLHARHEKFAALDLKIIDGRRRSARAFAHPHQGMKGDDLSLIAIGADARGVSTKGLFLSPQERRPPIRYRTRYFRIKLTGTHSRRNHGPQRAPPRHPPFAVLRTGRRILRRGFYSIFGF